MLHAEENCPTKFIILDEKWGFPCPDMVAILMAEGQSELSRTRDLLSGHKSLVLKNFKAGLL